MASRTETCGICGEKFTTTANGDKHRKILGKYDIWLLPDGGLLRVEPLSDDKTYIQAHRQMGFTLLSRGNQIRDCVDPSTVGLEKNKFGVWRSAETRDKSWWDTRDEEN